MKNLFLRAVAVSALLVIAQLGYAQTITVSGQVLDASDGQPMIGAGVVPSTGGGTVTDADGKYVISVPQNASLTFSSLGYVDVTEAVDGRTVINVSLSPDTEALDEVVVLGYTSQKKAELSSSVVSMSGDKLRGVASDDVGNMLQGKVAGVVVMNSSGQPGENANIRIRGTGSINAGAGPLYVVDGVAGGAFSPNDIETITVLKDASATALYGAAASGGVIVVTTKSGSQDKVNIELKASAGLKKALMGRFHAMDSEELYYFQKSMYSPAMFKLDHPESLLDQDFDWVNNCYRLGWVQNYYGSVSGRIKGVSYYASLDHYNEKGTLINTNYRKTSARVNLSAPLAKNLTMHVRLNYSKSFDQSASGWRLTEYSYYAMPWDIPFVMKQDEKGNWYQTDEYLYQGKDTDPRTDNGGKWWTQNPSNILHSEQYNYSKGHGDALTGDLQLVWNVTPWLTLTSSNRYDLWWSYYESYVDPRTFDGMGTGGELSNSNSEGYSWGTTDLAKFHKTFKGDHDLNAVVGWEFGQGYTRSMSASGTNFPEGQRSLSNSVMSSIDGYDYKSRSWAVLGQAQYAYQGKYIVTASIRYDESYKFGPLNRGGVFPGASAAWIISKENFMQKQNVISFLKLRGGYGKTGNDNIPAFQYQDIFALNSLYNGSTAAMIKQQANYNLGWEEAYMASIGIDATFKNNWNVTLDLYNTINTKLLLETPLAPSSGFFSRFANVGKVRNRGIELAVDGTILSRKNFVWTGGFNIGLNQNRVLELPDHTDIVLNKSEVAQMVREGRDIYSWYMPKWLGVDPENGDPLWETFVPDLDKDGNPTYYVDKNGKTQVKMKATTTNKYSQATQQIVGSASPWFSGGLNTAFHFYGVTISANGSFVVGNKIYNKTRENMDADGAYTNLNQMSIDNGLGWSRWEQKGDIATHPLPVGGRTDGSNKASSRYLEDGSFFRLRNVTISYDLPEKVIKKAKMSGVRFYVSGDNLLTISRFSSMDPEIRLDSDTYHHAGLYYANYPVPLSVNLGIDIQF